MSGRGAPFGFLLGVAAALAAAGGAIASGALHFRWGDEGAEGADDCACDGTPTTAGTEPRAAAGEPQAAPPRIPTASSARYMICAREEAPPRLSLLPAPTGRPSRLAIHCGSSVHLVAFDTQARALAPRRVARLALPAAPTGLSPQTASLAAGDIDGDGTGDLVLGQLFVDGSGAPRAGTVYLLPGAATGGLGAPRRIADGAPGAIAVGPFDATTGDDLALLQLVDPRVATRPELWFFSGGAAPLRSARVPTLAGTSELLAADLDGDGRLEAIAISPRSASYEVKAIDAGGAQAPEPQAIAGLREGLTADLDGDGQVDLLLLGDELSVRFAGRAHGPEAKPLFGASDLRWTSVHDTNADGKLDIVAYAHPAVVSFERAGADEFRRRDLFRLAGAAMTVYGLALTEIDGEPGLDALVLSVGEGVEEQVEIALFAGVLERERLDYPASSGPLPDAPVVQQIALP